MADHTIGISQYLADQWLGTLGVAPYFVTSPYFQLHTGIPGADGTLSVSQTVLRVPGTLTVSAGVANFTGIPPIWQALAAAETLSFISVWDASTAGNFLLSGQMLVPEIVAVNDQFALGSFALALTNLAS